MGEGVRINIDFLGGSAILLPVMRETTKEINCLFCILAPANEILDSNEYAIALLDMYPITKFHALIIPRRHTINYFELERRERESIHELLASQRKKIAEEDRSVAGFNVGWNCGEAAGQTVFHAHVHLIPRRKRDTANMQIRKQKSTPFTNPWHDNLTI